MKASIYIISILFTLLTNELSAQKLFQKRKYTKGVFCEVIEKVKKGQKKEMHLEAVAEKKANKTALQQNQISDTLTNKNSSPIDIIELPNNAKIEIVQIETIAKECTNKSSEEKLSINAQPLTASLNNRAIVLNKTANTKQFVLKSSASNEPDESFFSFLFGEFWKKLGTVLLVIAGIALVVGLLLFVLAVNAPWIYISLGVITLGGLVYLIIDNSPKKDTEGGEKVLAFLEKVGTPILTALCFVAAAMTRI